MKIETGTFEFHGDPQEVTREAGARVTPSKWIAIDDLGLDALYVVYPGTQRFRLAGGIEAVPPWAMLPAHEA